MDSGSEFHNDSVDGKMNESTNLNAHMVGCKFSSCWSECCSYRRVEEHCLGWLHTH